MIQSGAAFDYPIEPCPLCKAPIIWARDARMIEIPLNADTNPAGLYSVRPGPDGQPRAVRPTPKLAFGVALRELHYRTCRRGEQLRKSGRPHTV